MFNKYNESPEKKAWPSPVLPIVASKYSHEIELNVIAKLTVL